MRLIKVAGPVVLLAVIVFAGVGGPGKHTLACSPTLAFDVCLKDESNGNFLSFNSTTGAYSFTHCQPPLTVTGTGTVRKKGCIVVLEANTTDRKLLASAERCTKVGTVELRLRAFPNQRFTVFDRNTANSVCTCPI